jgi:hypothetical protein
MVLNEMASTEEIEQRVEEADSTRTARRAATAKRVFELANQRASVADQLNDLERELGDVLAASSDVIEIDELARFTDVSAADLTHWLTNRKTTRTRRKRTITGETGDTTREPSTARTRRVERKATERELATEKSPPGQVTARVT